jgi:molecular chaperone DnaJ
VVVDVVRHTYFQRDRHDVYCKLPVSFAQLALGADAPVPTLLGKAVIRIPPGTQPEQVLTLVGHGLPRPRGGRRGDQRVRVVLEVPRALDESRRDALLVAAAATDPGDTPLRRQVLDLLDEMG